MEGGISESEIKDSRQSIQIDRQQAAKHQHEVVDMKRKLDEADAREKAYIESQKKLYEMLASTTISTNTDTASATAPGTATILRPTIRTPFITSTTAPITCWNCWGKGHHAGKCPEPK